MILSMFFKKKHLFTRLSILLLFFIVFNLFLYSIISIGLYKLICYEKTNEWYTLIFSEKYTYVSYISDTKTCHTIWKCISDISFYCYTMQSDQLFLHDLFLECQLFSLPFLTWQAYSLMSNENLLENVNDINLIFMNFFIRSTHLNWIQSLQKTIIINFNESSLFFFIIYNATHLSVKLLTLYLIYPNFLTLYINKIQCFCFNAIFLYPLEIVDLPVLVYVYPFSNNFLVLNNIIIYYVIFLN